MTWCVSHAKPIPQWQNILYIADIESVAAFAAVVVLALCNLYLLYAFEEKPRDLIYCALLSIQTITTFPTMFRSKRTSIQFVFGILILIAFWLSTIFAAYIIVLLGCVRYETQIATLQDIVEKDFHLAGDQCIIDHFKVKNVVSSFLFCIIIRSFRN